MADGDSIRSGRAGGSGLIALAIIAAALIVTFGPSDRPRYQVAAAERLIVRLDNDSGAMIACDTHECRPVRLPDRAVTADRLRGVLGGGQDETEQRRIPQ